MSVFQLTSYLNLLLLNFYLFETVSNAFVSAFILNTLLALSGQMWPDDYIFSFLDKVENAINFIPHCKKIVILRF